VGRARRIQARKVSISRFFKKATLLESVVWLAIKDGILRAQWLKMPLKM